MSTHVIDAFNAMLGIAEQHPECSSVVIEVRGDGRADLDLLNAHRHVISSRQFYRDDDGTWVEYPRLMSGLAYCRPETENGGA